MNEAEALIGWLETRPGVGSNTVVGWRFELARALALRGGLRNSKLGGPYEAPGASDGLSGSLDLHWSDGRLTRTRLDRRAIEDPSGELAGWASLAEMEAHRPPLAAPADVPAVDCFDPALDEAIGAEPGRLLALLKQGQESQRLSGARRIDASLRAASGRRIVATSAGFRCEWPETAVSCDFWIDEIANSTFSKRRLPTPDERSALLQSVVELGERLRADTALPEGAHAVLFMPAAVEALLARFFQPNLRGRAILDDRSAFTQADLDEQRAVIADDLSLVIDTTMPLELATAPCSPDGVPAGSVTLIEGGRLVRPTLDLATAKELGLPPTPVPRGRPSLLLRSGRDAPDIEHAVEHLGDGVLVRDLPGLHTQSSQRWRYALVLPDAQAVVSGVPRGRCPVRVSGNLLDQLASPSTRLFRVRGERSPALLVADGLRIDGA